MDNRKAGKKIAQLRQTRCMTQQQLAAILNVSHQAVSKWESGLALPDIQTMLELTRFFGITVEQLLCEAETPEEIQVNNEDSIAEEATETICGEEPVVDDAEKNHMNIQQLQQMAPYMSKAAVEELALQMEDSMTAAHLTKLAPFVSQETLTALIEKHKPQFSWDSLKRIAPFMSREAVDALAKAIASGEETVESADDHLNRTINDISRAFDDLGRKAKRGVKKVIRFGGKVINEVSSAISEIDNDEEEKINKQMRTQRALEMRRKAFERALKDERWDWLGQHFEEIMSDTELRNRIFARARELEMHDWICEHMGSFADDEAINVAIDKGNWDWLGENAWQMEPDTQQRIALAAAQAQNWTWLMRYAELLNIKPCSLEIAKSALNAGETKLLMMLVGRFLDQQEVVDLARAAHAAGNYDALEELLEPAGWDYFHQMLMMLAESGEWERAIRHINPDDFDTIEKLMEMAIEQGNFTAIDALEPYLN